MAKLIPSDRPGSSIQRKTLRKSLGSYLRCPAAGVVPAVIERLVGRSRDEIEERDYDSVGLRHRADFIEVCQVAKLSSHLRIVHEFRCGKPEHRGLLKKKLNKVLAIEPPAFLRRHFATGFFLREITGLG
jgi:hypothetical protein